MAGWEIFEMFGGCIYVYMYTYIYIYISIARKIIEIYVLDFAGEVTLKSVGHQHVYYFERQHREI